MQRKITPVLDLPQIALECKNFNDEQIKKVLLKKADLRGKSLAKITELVKIFSGRCNSGNSN